MCVWDGKTQTLFICGNLGSVCEYISQGGSPVSLDKLCSMRTCVLNRLEDATLLYIETKENFGDCSCKIKNN